MGYDNSRHDDGLGYALANGGNVTKLISVMWLVGIFGWGAAGSSYAFNACGELNNAYGPYDYWTDKDKLPIVEINHFTPEVEGLVKGKSGYLAGDLDYTLRAFPNHPRALFAMMRLGEREKTERLGAAHYSVFCYFDRAIRFRPEDAMARMIYGIYLAKHKKNEAALAQLQVAVQHASDNGNLHYNIGLVFFDLGKFDDALRHAHIAYRLGFELPGLRAKLERAGKWVDEPPTAASQDASATEPSADELRAR